MTDYKPLSVLLACIIAFSLGGCSEKRMDPCRLLSVADVKEIDNTVKTSLWAGRGGEKKDDEVCMFYTGNGDPRVMLFVWYDKNNDPRNLVAKGADSADSEIIQISRPGKEASASVVEKELKLLAVKSANGLIGLRVRKPIEKNSAEFDKLLDLSEKALDNIKAR